MRATRSLPLLLALALVLPGSGRAEPPGTPPGTLHQARPQAAARAKEQASADARSRFRAVNRELRELEARREPWIALEEGRADDARDALQAGPASPELSRTTLRTVQARLRRIATADLSRLERAQLATVEAWIRAQRTLQEAAAAERTDPVVLVVAAERTLLAILETESLTVLERVLSLDVLLGELPERWKAARNTLTTGVLPWSREALMHLAALERFLRTDLPVAADAPALGERGRDALLERIRVAADATAAFRAWLEKGPAASGRPARGIGERAFYVTLATMTGHELEPQLLRAELLDAIAREDAGRLTPEEARPDEQRPARALIASLERGLAAGLLLARYNGVDRLVLVPLPVMSARIARGGARPRELLRLLAGPKSGLVLALEEPSREWPGGLNRGLAGLLGPLDLSAEAVRRGPGGEGLFLYVHGSLGTEERLPILPRPIRGGFGLYALDAAIRLGLPADFPGGATMGRAASRQRLLEASRLLAALELHADGLAEDEVIDRLRRRTGMELDLAKDEVRRIGHDALRGADFLGYLEFMRLEAFLAESLPPAESARRTLALALTAPGVRPRDLRTELIEK